MVHIVARWYDQHEGGIARLKKMGWFEDKCPLPDKGFSVLAVDDDEVELPASWLEPYEVLLRAEECRLHKGAIVVCDCAGAPLVPVKAGWPFAGDTIFEAPEEIVTVFVYWDQNIWAPTDKVVVTRHQLLRKGLKVRVQSEEILRSQRYGDWKDSAWAAAIWAAWEKMYCRECEHTHFARCARRAPSKKGGEHASHSG